MANCCPSMGYTVINFPLKVSSLACISVVVYQNNLLIFGYIQSRGFLKVQQIECESCIAIILTIQSSYE
jgi:hypothetical protein